jgi:replicative DNA helicase
MLLSDNNVYWRVNGSIRPSDFSGRDARRIWEFASEELSNGRAVDAFLVGERFPDIDRSYLFGLIAESGGSANAEAYARHVADAACQRELTTLLAKATGVAGSYPWKTIVAGLQKRLTELETARGSDDITFAKVLESGLEELDARQAGKISGIDWGIPALNAALTHLSGPRLIVLAGRPGLGKTALAQLCALRTAAAGNAVGMVHLEMGTAEIGIRALAESYGISMTALYHGDPGAVQQLREAAKANDISKYPIYVTDSAYGLHEICGQIANWVSRRQIRAGFIDHLQLIDLGVASGQRLTDRLSYATSSLKRLAKRFDIPIILLSQLNRANEREGRRPTPADLRDSGSIEQDADVIIMLHGSMETDEDGNRDVEIGIPKNRIGRTGWLSRHRFQFNGPTQRFAQLEPQKSIPGSGEPSGDRPLARRYRKAKGGESQEASGDRGVL